MSAWLEFSAHFEKESKLRGLLADIYSDTPRKWAALRKFYEIQTPHGYSPYPCEIDWYRVLGSPAEEMAQQVIRGAGLDMWPQYPVGRYFVDFGDPYKKIALEVDGRNYHDVERDRKRDSELFELGWTVYRVSGSEAYRSAEENDEWRANTVEGVVSAVNVVHYGKGAATDLHFKTLRDHCLIPEAVEIAGCRLYV